MRETRALVDVVGVCVRDDPGPQFGRQQTLSSVASANLGLGAQSESPECGVDFSFSHELLDFLHNNSQAQAPGLHHAGPAAALFCVPAQMTAKQNYDASSEEFRPSCLRNLGLQEPDLRQAGWRTNGRASGAG